MIYTKNVFFVIHFIQYRISPEKVNIPLHLVDNNEMMTSVRYQPKYLDSDTEMITEQKP